MNVGKKRSGMRYLGCLFPEFKKENFLSRDTAGSKFPNPGIVHLIAYPVSRFQGFSGSCARDFRDLNSRILVTSKALF